MAVELIDILGKLRCRYAPTCYIVLQKISRTLLAYHEMIIFGMSEAARMYLAASLTLNLLALMYQHRYIGASAVKRLCALRPKVAAEDC